MSPAVARLLTKHDCVCRTSLSTCYFLIVVPVYPKMASLNLEQTNSQTNQVNNCICKTCNKAIQDSNNCTVCDTCWESNHETFCPHLLGKLNSTVCPLKCESNKERNNNCPSLLNGDNNNNYETSAISLRESNRQKFSNNCIMSNSISQSLPKNFGPINQDEVHCSNLFINSEYYEIDYVIRTTINFYSKACRDSLFMMHFNVKNLPKKHQNTVSFCKAVSLLNPT